MLEPTRRLKYYWERCVSLLIINNSPTNLITLHMGIHFFVPDVASAREHNIYESIAKNHPFDGVFTMVGDAVFLLGLLILLFALYKKVKNSYSLSTGEARNEQSIYIHNFFIAAIILITTGVMLISLAYYLRSSAARIPLSFSSRAMSNALWESYKKTYVDDAGRTYDPSRDNITTSEGQSYTMLRAVLVDDKETFDKSFKWTQKNLARENDSLFAWKYGKRSDGTYGILAGGGYNTASDADTDIALSLIFAYSRWQEPQYLKSAVNIINDIWDLEVIPVGGKPYLAANNVEKNYDKQFIVLNPSYYAPYAYRIFSKIDQSHPWMELVDTSYDVITESIGSNLDKSASAELIPDWVVLDTISGKISALQGTDLTTNYSYDAMRLPWRLALDWKWNKEPRAKAILSRNKFLLEDWQKNERLNSTYDHSGAVIHKNESPAIYGGTIGYFLVTDPSIAKEIYRKKLLILFDPNNNTWKESLSYYDDNWVWFGMALYNDQFTDLTKHISFLSTN